ncbi:MAG: flagellar filament capping protein FliD [Sterolibacterium sp.]|nr:flagellar filament capping protein FliD [Sterolibacterium sp.]
MAMIISSMTSTAIRGNNNYGAGVLSVASDPVARAFDGANKRVGKPLESTNVQVSAFGQIKSGFANLQTVGSGLSSLNKTSTDSDTISAAQSFIEAFNNTSNVISTNTKGTGNTGGVLSDNSNAVLAGYDLKRTLTSGSNTAELRKIGISVNSSGTLSLDTKALGSALTANSNAVKDTLAKVGNQVAQVSTKELNGNIGSAVNTLSTRAKDLAAQQNAASLLLAIQQSVTDVSRGASVGIAAYMKVLFTQMIG